MDDIVRLPFAPETVILPVTSARATARFQLLRVLDGNRFVRQKNRFQSKTIQKLRSDILPTTSLTEHSEPYGADSKTKKIFADLRGFSVSAEFFYRGAFIARYFGFRRDNT